MNEILAEILAEIKSKVDKSTYDYIQNVFTIKFHGYDIVEKSTDTEIMPYSEDENTRIVKKYFVTKKLQGLSDRTLEAYATTLKYFFNDVNKLITQITTDDIRYFLAMYQMQHECSNLTLDNYRRNLNAFFEYCAEEEYIPKNPCKRIKAIKHIRKVKKAFSSEEIVMLKMACESKRETALINFLLSTGARAKEVNRVKLDDINWDAGEVKILGKGSKERVVYLNAEAKLTLKDYIQNERQGDSEHVFVATFKPYSEMQVGGIEQMLTRIGERAKVNNVHPHRFRRTFATLCCKRGMPVEEIQQLLGHEKLDTTMLYVQLDNERISQSHKKYMN